MLPLIQVNLKWKETDLQWGNSDIDLSAFLLNKEGVVEQETDFIFFNNTANENSSVTYLGDSQPDTEHGKTETIQIDFNQMPQHVQRLVLVATMVQVEDQRVNFGQFTNAKVEIFETDLQEPVVIYDLAEDFSLDYSLEIGEFYFENNDWHFKSTIKSYDANLAAICKNFGLEVE